MTTCVRILVFCVTLSRLSLLVFTMPFAQEAAYHLTDYNSDELKETFGVNDISKVPDHKFVWPSVDLITDDNGNSVINRLLINSDSSNDAPKLSIPLILVENPMKMPIGVRNCHYRSLQNDTDTDSLIHAAVSDCDGQLRGTIITDKDVFVLHPLPNRKQKYGPMSKTNDTVVRDYKTHALIKRQSLVGSTERKNDFCGIQNSHPISNVARDSPILDAASTARRISSESGMSIEIAIFVDSEMWKKWNDYSAEADSKLQDFISTVFNNIQILYQHPTMSYKVNFQIVHYDVMKNQPDAISGYRHRDGDAQMYLDAFCLYQYGFTGRTWDQAILFTGYDLHRNYGQDKSISGIARLYGACDPFNSCVLVEAHDFTSVFIATHEIGHGFGMRHDEPYCSSTFIMSGSLGPGKVTWSSCSMNDMGKFIEKLDYNGKNCLRHTSGYSALTIDMSQLPGQKYDADAQCAMMHGPGYHHVIPRNQYSEGACSMMWCGMNGFGRIITAHPALEGSFCGERRYCLRGQCQVWISDIPLPTEIPRPAEGLWGDWTKPTCGICNCAPFPGALGIVQSTRSCASRPNGRDCTGDYVRGLVCNANCPATADTVDAYSGRQCEWRRSQGNDPQMTGRGAQLLRSDARACKVFCEIQPSAFGAKNFRFYGDLVPDGSPCGSGKYCVAGRCLALGCDNSALVSDSSSCPTTYEKCQAVPNFPQVSPTQAVISTSSVANGLEWASWSSWTQCSTSCETGVQTRSRRCNNPFGCSGPSDERRMCNRGPCDNLLPNEGELWNQWSQWSPWSPCSSVCGEGNQTRARMCSGRCDPSAFEKYRETRPCFGEICSGTWSSWGMWSECYAGAVAQIRIRSCQGNGKCAGQKDSTDLDRQQRPCPGANDNIGKWTPWTSWTSCSRSCGTGDRTRVRTCSSIRKGACFPGDSTQQETCAKVDCPNGPRIGRGAVSATFSEKYRRYFFGH